MAQTIENIVDPNDPSLTSEMVQFPGTAGNVSAYVSRPKDGKNLGTVIVIHENRGLVNHIKDVARHFAKDGFAAIAVDCMGRIGGSDKWNGSDEATKEIQKLTGDMVAEDLTAALNYMKKQITSTARSASSDIAGAEANHLTLLPSVRISTPPWSTTAEIPIPWNPWRTFLAPSWATTLKMILTLCRALSRSRPQWQKPARALMSKLIRAQSMHSTTIPMPTATIQRQQRMRGRGR